MVDLLKYASESLNHDWSIIPLQGGSEASTGKRPFLKSWSEYQKSLPTSEDIHVWFSDENCSAYGVVCGQISSLIVLDIDDPDVAESFQSRFPTLCQTFTVQSGLRSTPHFYWKVDFPVKTKKLMGSDLKAEGSYVVGPGSEIAGATWSIARDFPVRAITSTELDGVLAFLSRPAQRQNKSTSIETDRPTGRSDILAYYRQHVEVYGGRNECLFRTACLARDSGHSYDWTLETLVRAHAHMEPLANHPPETAEQRYHEAWQTVASAYSRPARDWHHIRDKGASHFPNPLREVLLQRQEGDGVAVLRVLEGLWLKGIRAGDSVTEKDMLSLLQGVVGRHSIRRSLDLSLNDGNPLFKRFVRFCPTNKNAFFCFDSVNLSESARAGGGLEGEASRRITVYVYPDIQELCQRLDVDYRYGDAIVWENLTSVKTYREALEVELIRRRPGAYAQRALAGRLGVSDRSIRRYHRELPIHSQRTYEELWIGWHNLHRLPGASDTFPAGGHTLVDETGKVYPALREIARRLLSAGHQVLYRIQGVSVYWYGSEKPDTLHARLAQAGYASRPLPEQANHKPAIFTNRVSNAEAPPAKWHPEVSTPQVYIKTIDAPTYHQSLAELQSPRFYRQPLPDSFQEGVAQRLYQAVPELSLCNMRRLVSLYGTGVAEAAFKQANNLARQDKLLNPAGFMVAATQAEWRRRYGWGCEKPVFKAQPQGRSRKGDHPDKDPLMRSEPWLRWRIWLAYEDGDTASVEKWQNRLTELGYESEVLFNWADPVYDEILF